MYALNLADDGRILSVTLDRFAPPEQPRVETLPDGDVTDYLYVNKTFVYDPILTPDQPDPNRPKSEDRITALEDKIASYEAAYAEGVNEA